MGTIIFFWNTPANNERQPHRTAQLVRVFVFTLIISGITLYIMTDNDSNAMMTNIIKGDPDF
jgi:hypothetical protein